MGSDALRQLTEKVQLKRVTLHLGQPHFRETTMKPLKFDYWTDLTYRTAIDQRVMTKGELITQLVADGHDPQQARAYVRKL